ncbi:16857_t:CDS:2 [Acaulospora morrowiae]|uniref:16857_t:CDS:1 n=1 Tax=Acaulospora morrowiae TaxID=94023 RepID=A0A9N9IGM1_9GLOM|nr:16857_t:CDS:2 [Acaulospora morrowiae]
MSELYAKVYNFIVTAEEENINASTVIYQALNEEPWIPKEEIRGLVHRAISSALNLYAQGSTQQQKISQIPLQSFLFSPCTGFNPGNMRRLVSACGPHEGISFACDILTARALAGMFEVAYEGVCGLLNIGALKVSKEKPITLEQIDANLKKLKLKLTRDSSTLARELTLGLRNVTASSLEWSDPLANQIIDDSSDLVNHLPPPMKKTFLKPARRMVPPNLPIIREMCREFVTGFDRHQTEDIPRLLKHDVSWKESVEVLKEVTKEILSTVKDIWNNPAFGPNFVDSLNEGTYISNVVVPLIRATLKNLPFGKSSFISTYERQSIASKDRRGVGKTGRRPDIMFEVHREGKVYELLYGECSRIFCTPQKELDDKIKLWREVNDGLYWVRKGCKPEKEQFGIIGIQVAGRKLHLSVITRGVDEIHRFYNLHSAEIPVNPMGDYDLINFIKTLLTLRNMIIVNMSLLFHASTSISHRQEDSSTVSSPLYDN